MIAAPRSCTACGAPMPASAPGCPECLLRAVLDFSAVRDLGPNTDPDLVELQPHFPDLEIQSLAGRGGMGVVYRAHDRATGELVALKILAPRLADDPIFVERFLREAQAMRKLAHPRVVAIRDSGRVAESAFITMEFVEGFSLRDRLLEERPSPAAALGLMLQIAEAVSYAHERGIVHRDLKPGNVLVDHRGQVKLADFGLAKLVEAEFTLTGSSANFGTAHYMAPEQRTHSAAVDCRADVYSLGVMLYELLTGTLPTLDYVPPSVKAGSDPRLDRVVQKCLREQPGERFESAREFHRAVQRIACTRCWPWKRLAAAAAVVLVPLVVWASGGFTAKVDPFAPTPGSPTARLTADEFAWSEPINLGAGVNSAASEGAPYLTADGLTLLFRSDRVGGFGGSDLYEARRASLGEPFANPTNLGPLVNTAGGEDGPCLSADELTLYFTSSSSAPRGQTDIWTSRRATKDAPWQAAVKLGDEVNSASFEFRPWVSRDGLRLTFSSLRPPWEGIYACARASTAEPWGAAQPISPDYNAKQLGGISFSSDDRTLLCNRLDAFFPGDLLWLARIDDRADPFRNLKSFGPTVNAAAIEILPMPSIEGDAVYFESNRPGTHGGPDLWQTLRRKK